MALIHWGTSEDFPKKSAGRATLSSVDFNMVIWGIDWGCCDKGYIWGGAGDCLGGAMGAGPTGGMQWCLEDG